MKNELLRELFAYVAIHRESPSQNAHQVPLFFLVKTANFKDLTRQPHVIRIINAPVVTSHYFKSN